MKKPLSIAASVAGIAYLLLAGAAYAALPTLTVTAESGNSYQIAVSGDPDSRIDLYLGSPSGRFVAELGATAVNGYLSEEISNQYGIQPGQQVYVVVDGQTSSPTAWPSPYQGGYYYGSGISFSPGSLSLNLGQSASVSIFGGSGSSYYVSSPSSVASASVAGNTLNVYGTAAGVGSIAVCSSYGSGQCGTLYVTVAGGTQPVTVSLGQSNAQLTVGQSETVSVYGSGGFYIGSNSNPSAASASISGNSLSLYAEAPGTANISVCEAGGSCTSFSVTVNGQLSYYNNYNPTYYYQPPTYSYPSYPTYSYPTYSYYPATVYYTTPVYYRIVQPVQNFFSRFPRW